MVFAVLTVLTITGRAQVTLQQITNGLVDYYSLDQFAPGTTNMMMDLINGRDLRMVGMGANNIVPGSHRGMGGGSNVINLTQTPGPTVLVYQSTGQNPLNGSGDFLPFINQRGATMNFWIKGADYSGTPYIRVMAEAANNGDNGPWFSLNDQVATKVDYLLRLNNQTTDPNGAYVNQFSDGTYQQPSYYYVWSQLIPCTTNAVFDNNWHMLTTIIESNGDFHVFVDGRYDPGDQTYGPVLDREGSPAIAPPIPVTNTYYTTNLYPLVNPPASNPPPNGFVRWMVPGLNQAGAFTAFGGDARNGIIRAGVPCQMSDIAFWNRILSPAEIQFVMTNGVPDCIVIDCSFCRPSIYSFSAAPSTVHPGESVTFQWHIQAVTSEPIVSLLLDPVIGEVTNVTDYSTGNGSANLPVFTNTTFELSLTNLNNCGYVVGQFPRFAAVTVVPLSFSAPSYLPSDPGNAGNPSFTLTWSSVSNHMYTVQRKFNLTDPSWTTLASGLASGGNSTSFTDYTLGSGYTAFYRIVCP